MMPTPRGCPCRPVHADGRHDAGRPRRLVANAERRAYVQVNANNIGDREYISGCYGTGNCYWEQSAAPVPLATVGYDF